MLWLPQFFYPALRIVAEVLAGSFPKDSDHLTHSNFSRPFNDLIERRTRDEASRKQLENDRIVLEQLGGKELAIKSFYASPGVIRKGENVQLCYGVANANWVDAGLPMPESLRTLTQGSVPPVRMGFLSDAADLLQAGPGL